MLSENDAREKWCPYGRVLSRHKDTGNIERIHAGYNRIWRDDDTAAIASGSACIASQCMAWRWGSEKELRDIDLVTGDIEKAERLGYCGLSGKSEYGD